jgi:lysozyme
LDEIKGYEQFRGTAYQNDGDVPTIGYGHTGPDVTVADVGKKTITKRQAERLLRQDVAKAEAVVKRNVKVCLTQGQYDALVSLVFNIGAGNFKNSTLLKKLNAGDYRGASAEFPMWNKSNGVVSPGLVKRRAAERKMFDK